jgi:hypothetical protein
MTLTVPPPGEYQTFLFSEPAYDLDALERYHIR